MQLALVLFLLFWGSTRFVGAEESIVSFTDAAGDKRILPHPPQRVVSLVPSVTEILLRLGVEGQLVGVTHNSVLPAGVTGKEIVGGFFRPDLDRVENLAPDVIFYADLHTDVHSRFRDKALLMQLAPRSIEEGFSHIRFLGRMFGQEAKAQEIIAEQKRQLAVIARKTEKIPSTERLRVMRLMGRDTVMTPGDDSFQNEYIRAGGGIAPVFGQNGHIIPVSLEQWRQFNPQVLYGCGADRVLLRLLRRPGWQEVDAVRNNRIFFFPCDLTCRVATHPGYFVSWLAAEIYEKQFSEMELVLPAEIVRRTPLSLDLEYVTAAEIIESDIHDFRNKTIALTFSHPMRVISTLEGQRENIRLVANHYFPPPSWGLGHRQGLAVLRQSTEKVLEFAAESTAMLFTGADMDNLAVVKKTFRELEVTALASAGVTGNAMRMGVDAGLFYEPDKKEQESTLGTINILLLTNTALSPQAMSRGIITATEAKSAALQDLDIRSSVAALSHQATGTGTDNIIVVEGAGLPITSSGGHTKMGELIAAAVYEAVQQAIYRQNGLVQGRSVFQRLRERHIDLSSICPQALRADFEHLLLQPSYAAFITSSLAISDAYQQGLIGDLDPFFAWCGVMAQRIAGRPVTLDEQARHSSSPVIHLALAALVQGLEARFQ